eukprot:scaffold162_cov176-Amphora_coffeaeformis.AAC.10
MHPNLLPSSLRHAGLREKKFSVSGLVPEVRKRLNNEKVKRPAATEKAKEREAAKKMNSHSYTETPCVEDEKGAQKRELGQTKTPTKQNKRTKTKTANANPTKTSAKTRTKAPLKKKIVKKALSKKKRPVPNSSPAKPPPLEVSPGTPITHRLFLSLPRGNPATVTPPVDVATVNPVIVETPADVVTTVSLGFKDTSVPRLLYQSPGSLKSIKKLSLKRQDEELAMMQAFRESFKDSARYARETMKRHWDLDMESFPVDHEAENLVHILRPCLLRKHRPGAMLPLPVFHDHEQ